MGKVTKNQLDLISENNTYPDYIIIGNVIKRGMPIIERILREKLSYISGPDWLNKYLLKDKLVLAVAGTHGKTSTSSMLAWMLTDLGLDPGYLIGGIPKDLSHPVAFGSGKYFIIEADEYDTAFFDKRAKFVHYSPDILILNNLEFDHADIYSDLDAIKKQMHHVVRIVPDNGVIIAPDKNCDKYGSNISDVLNMGVWSNVKYFRVNNLNNNLNNNLKNSSKNNWYIKAVKKDCSEFDIFNNNIKIASGKWAIQGEYNLHNALAAVIAVCSLDVNITAQQAVDSLAKFTGVKRRCECIFDGKYKNSNLKIYDDFAHHPTAIRETLTGFRNKYDNKTNKIIVMLEPRSNTMKMNIHLQMKVFF